MRDLLVNGYNPRLRPSGHDISDKFQRDNGGAIPPNLISLAHTESNSTYIRYCTEQGLKPHPARYPSELPEFFIRMLTDVNDLVFDPFAGSCMTGEVAERICRRWICSEIVEDYLRGAVGRFQKLEPTSAPSKAEATLKREAFYRATKPGTMWNGVHDDELLPTDGGIKRAPKKH